MSFKFSDLFPIRNGDLVQINDETNKLFANLSKDPYNRGNEVNGHDLMGMNLIVVSEPYLGTVSGWTNEKIVDVYCQNDMKTYTVEVIYLQRILF